MNSKATPQVLCSSQWAKGGLVLTAAGSAAWGSWLGHAEGVGASPPAPSTSMVSRCLAAHAVLTAAASVVFPCRLACTLCYCLRIGEWRLFAWVYATQASICL